MHDQRQLASPPAAVAPAASLWRTDYIWFLAGVGSWFASWGMQGVLFTWLVVGELEADPSLVGTAQSCLLVPGLVLVLIGGAAADRWDRRTLLFWYHLVGGCLVFALAGVVAAGALTFPALLAYALSMGTVAAFLVPTRESTLADVAGPNMMRAVTGVTLIQFGVQALGSALAGTARWVGTGAALSLQGMILFAGILAVRNLPASLPVQHAAGARTTTWTQIKEGLREVWRSERLRSPVLLVMSNGLLFLGPFLVVFPLLVRDVYQRDIDALGLVYMSFPLGTIVGSAILLRRGVIRKKGRALLIAMFGGGLCLSAASLHPPFWGLLVLVFLWGLFGSIFFNSSRTLVQEAAPPTHRARVLSVYWLAIMGAGPAGALQSGFVAGEIGPLLACALSGIAMLVLIAVVAAFSDISRLD